MGICSDACARKSDQAFLSPAAMKSAATWCQMKSGGSFAEAPALGPALLDAAIVGRPRPAVGRPRGKLREHIGRD